MKEELGERLRAERERRRLSLRAVAAGIGISPGMLSQVETGRIYPSLTTLYELVSYLEVSVDQLLGLPESFRSDEGDEDGPVRRSVDVVRGAAGASIEVGEGITWQRLANGGFAGLDSILVTYAPGASSEIDGRLERHAGLQAGYLIEGVLNLTLEFDQWTLRAGDSFGFDSQRPHSFRNASTEPARGVWFMLGRSDAETAGALDDAVSVTSVRSAVDVLRSMRSLPKDRVEAAEATEGAPAEFG